MQASSSKLGNLLSVIIAQTKFKDSLSTKLGQSLVKVDADLVVVLVCFISQTKNLSSINIMLNIFSYWVKSRIVLTP